MFRSAAQKLSLQTATQTRTLLTHNGIRSLSTEAPSSGGILNRIKNTFGSSNSDSIPGSGSKSKPSAQDEAYAKQISQMAHSEKWSLANFHQQVVDSSGGWKAKLPGMGNTDAVKQMKAMQQLLEAAMEVAGRDAGANELNDLGKKGKVSILKSMWVGWLLGRMFLHIRTVHHASNDMTNCDTIFIFSRQWVSFLFLINCWCSTAQNQSQKWSRCQRNQCISAAIQIYGYYAQGSEISCGKWFGNPDR
jgi:hypothetical protein